VAATILEVIGVHIKHVRMTPSPKNTCFGNSPFLHGSESGHAIMGRGL